MADVFTKIIWNLEALFKPNTSQMDLSDIEWAGIDSYNQAISDAITKVKELKPESCAVSGKGD